MKKKIIVLIILLIPFIVKASSLSLECNTDVVKTEQLSCTIKGNSTTNITSISAKVIAGNNINFVSFTPSSAWKGDGEEGQIELYTADDINGNFNIGTINFKVTSLYDGGTSSITIDQISFYDEDGIEESITKVNKSIRIASNNNDLSSLSLSNGNIYPTFNKDTVSYSTQINANNVTIIARASSNKATISGDIGTKNLNYGNNNFNIIVTSESGNKKTYTISIVRPNNNNNDNTPVIEDNKSNNNYLSNITLSTGNINFNKEILEYNVIVLYEVKDLDITAVPEDSKSKVEISGNKELKVGTNKITILVTAEDGSKREYIINVDRKNEDEKLSNNTNISKLIIDNYNINFNKDKLNYDLKIKYEKKLNINVELEDSTSTYKIQGNNNLNNKSIIKIIVTSADNSTKTYTINIKNNDTIIKIAFVLLITVLIITNILRIILKKQKDSLKY